MVNLVWFTDGSRIKFILDAKNDDKQRSAEDKDSTADRSLIKRQQ